MQRRAFFVLGLLATAAGLFFATVSTFDFVAHLDRQVHGLHCSFIPGITGTDVSGASGCHVTLMSPYSSVLRDRIWGGIPVSLPAMAVFAFLFAFLGGLGLTGRTQDRGATGFFLAATLLPVLASAVMGTISFVELGAACKLCVGIYASSALCLAAAIGLHRRGRWDAVLDDDAPAPGPSPLARQALRFGAGVLFVGTALGAYVLVAPDYSRFVGACGELKAPDDPYEVMVPLGPSAPGAVPAIEVFDPLCPSCRGFEERLAASGLAERLERKALLFPLDDACNWMVGTAVHPGACTVSEAVLCAGNEVDAVVAWAFEQQEAIRVAATEDPEAAKRMVLERFPAMRGCVGTPKGRNRLQRSLRWAVANELPVLTPQLYVGGTKLCDEDTDLGMDYALKRLLDRAEGAPAREAMR